MNDLDTINEADIASVLGGDKDPAAIGYPALLPVELVLRDHKPKEICQAFGISAERWERIRQDPVFLKDLAARDIELKSEGLSFKMKARLQCDNYLKKLWDITEDKTVAAKDRAQIMQFIIRAAGLDGSKDQAANVGVVGNALSITLHLG